MSLDFMESSGIQPVNRALCPMAHILEVVTAKICYPLQISCGFAFNSVLSYCHCSCVPITHSVGQADNLSAVSDTQIHCHTQVLEPSVLRPWWLRLQLLEVWGHLGRRHLLIQHYCC